MKEKKKKLNGIVNLVNQFHIVPYVVISIAIGKEYGSIDINKPRSLAFNLFFFLKYKQTNEKK